MGGGFGSRALVLEKKAHLHSLCQLKDNFHASDSAVVSPNYFMVEVLFVYLENAISRQVKRLEPIGSSQVAILPRNSIKSDAGSRHNQGM